MEKPVLRQIKIDAIKMGVDLNDIIGITTREFYDKLEAMGAIMYWGLWSNEDLSSVIPNLVK